MEAANDKHEGYAQWPGSVTVILASSVSDILNVLIAVGTLAGLIGAGLWRLRGLIRTDNRNTIREELRPFAQAQQENSRDIASLQEWRPMVDHKLQTHAEQISYLKGKEDARAELASGISGVSNIAQALAHIEEEPRHEEHR